jgi:hypothetical protein
VWKTNRTKQQRPAEELLLKPMPLGISQKNGTPEGEGGTK